MNEWITDRKPDKPGRYIGYLPGVGVEILYYSEKTKFMMSIKGIHVICTAWMPLPKPPEITDEQ
jgi:hypothetical protein